MTNSGKHSFTWIRSKFARYIGAHQSLFASDTLIREASFAAYVMAGIVSVLAIVTCMSYRCHRRRSERRKSLAHLSGAACASGLMVSRGTRSRDLDVNANQSDALLASVAKVHDDGVHWPDANDADFYSL